MIHRTFLRSLIACLLSGLITLLAMPNLVFSKSPAGVVETLTGVVDYNNMTVRARGVGYPIKNPIDQRHARETARIAAGVVAQDKLLETIQGIQLRTNTTVNNQKMMSKETRVWLEGYVSGARLVHERELENGGYEVTIEKPWSGEFVTRFIPELGTKKLPVIDSPRERKSPSPPLLTYTGIVVDALGLAVTPGHEIRLLAKDGTEVYAAEYVKKDVGLRKSLVAYESDLKSAQTNQRVRTKPRVIKAIEANGGDVVISDSEGRLLLSSYPELLRNGKVVLVTDQQQPGR